MKLKIVIVALLGCLLPACRPAPAVSPIAVKRVVALLPNLTRIVVELGAGDRLVGYSRYSKIPGLPPTAVDVGGALDPNYELIISLQPDLILLQDTQKDQRAKLENMGLRVLAVPLFTIRDVLGAIKTIGAKLERSPAADQLTSRLQQDLERLKQRWAGEPPVRTMLVIGHEPGALRDIYLAAPGSFLDELLKIAGGENVLRESLMPYPKINKETIMQFNPQVILVLAPGQDDSPAALDHERRLWSELPYLEAVKTGRVYLLTDWDILTPDPRMTQITEAFSGFLHPEKGQSL